MRIYLVRVRATHKLQGVFWAASIADLWDTVDEMGDPAFCEHAEMTRPSGLWHEMSYAETPEPHVGEHECPPGADGSALLCAACLRRDDADEDYFDQMKFVRSGELFPWSAEEQDKMDWTPFDFADEGEGMIARVIREVQ